MQVGELPDEALLGEYARQGAYTDCYFMELPRPVTFEEYVHAFYTTALFKLERKILSVAARKPSTDLDAQQLAQGRSGKFSAWTVEGREPNQLLLCDLTGRTRSWLMVREQRYGDERVTRLYFGSAVVPKSKSASGRASFGFAFHALSGFHRLYTRALMTAALAKLSQTNA